MAELEAMAKAIALASTTARPLAPASHPTRSPAMTSPAPEEALASVIRDAFHANDMMEGLDLYVGEATKLARAILASGYALPAESGEYAALTAKAPEFVSYYRKWAKDIRALNGASVDADHADNTAALIEQAARAISSLSAEKEKAFNAWTGAAAERDELRAQLAAAREALEWRPIETAPKDGTHIMVSGPHADDRGQYVETCHWHDPKSTAPGAWTITYMHGHGVPTHWMPLCKPPFQEPRDE